MTISVKIIEGSINQFNKKITTFELTYPRFIHSEIMTHRVFSRNSASSRAIPTKRILHNILNDMATPIHWGKNQSGMQAFSELTPFKKWMTQKIWKISGYTSIGFAWILDKIGAHKQIVNRIIEPWSHITIILTTTELDNFFELRDHKDAQPEIALLSKKMKEAINNFKYKPLKNDEWHLPYVTEVEKNKYPLGTLIKISVARCARVSYLTHDGQLSTVDKDLKLYEKLVGSIPLHASPAEHQATLILTENDKKYQGNFSGFVQFRKILEEKFIGINSKRVLEIFSYK